jgi:hypothetical protein
VADVGRVLERGELLMLRRVGEVQGPSGRYEILSDPRGQMVVRSLLTGRKFLLRWEDAVGIASANGVDDRGPA